MLLTSTERTQKEGAHRSKRWGTLNSEQAETLHTSSQLLDHGQHESVYPSSLFITIYLYSSTAPPNPLASTATC